MPRIHSQYAAIQALRGHCTFIQMHLAMAHIGGRPSHHSDLKACSFQEL
jgi:hypothetical protein